MDKIICDVCGTAYPQTAAQCPICGYARMSDAKVIPAQNESSAGSYTYVKGGRFSSNNVRKHNSGDSLKQSHRKQKSVPAPFESSQQPKPDSNKPLGCVVVVLLVVLIIILSVLIVKVLQERTGGDEEPRREPAPQSSQKDPGCTEISLESETVLLSEAGAKHLIHVSDAPKDHIHTLTFSSSAPEVAQVSDNGTVTAVSSGNAQITVRCGDISAILNVECVIAPDAVWELNRSEITFSSRKDSWDLYDKTGTVPKADIIWTSTDEAVAKVVDGVVTPVGDGSAKIIAKYGSEEKSCKIICALPKLKISHKDVTIAVGERFEITLKDTDGNIMDVTWTAEDADIVKISGNTITGAKSGHKTNVSVTFEGNIYTCTVRVK